MKEFWESVGNTKELVNTISSRRNLAANGTDAIPNCIYTQAPEQAAEYFHIIIKAIRIMRRIPTSWKIARTILLYKKNDPSIISNWRPITIANTDYRIVMTHLARCMQHLNNTTAFISKQQRGFVNGINGCAGHIFALQELMMHAQRTKQDFYACTVDFKNAFCSVPHTLIQKKLEEFGFDEEICAIMRDNYKDTKTVLQINGDTSNPIPIRKGVKQGCPISPLLFNIAIEPLIRRISSLHRSEGIKVDDTVISIQAYADDVVLLSSSRRGLMNMICTLERFCRYAGMRLAEEKCSVISYIQQNGRRVQDGLPFKMNGIEIQSIPIMKFTEYLGAPISRMTNVRFKHSISIVDEAKWKLNQLMTSPLRTNQKLDVIRRFIIPSFDYSFITNGIRKNDLKEIDALIRKTISQTLKARGIPIPFYHTNWRDGGASIPCLMEREDCIVIRTYLYNKYFADKYTRKLSSSFETSEVHFRGINLEESQTRFLRLPLDSQNKLIQKRNGCNTLMIRAVKASTKFDLKVNEAYDEVVIIDRIKDDEYKCKSGQKTMSSLNTIMTGRWKKKLHELPLKGHSFLTLENSPCSSYFMSPAIPVINDNVMNFVIMGRNNDLLTREILAHGKKTPTCSRCHRGRDSLMHRLNACLTQKSQFKERHNMVVAEIEKAIRSNTNQRIRFHRSTQLRLEGAPLLPPDTRSLLSDLWFIDNARNTLRVIEVTVPYGSFTDDEIGTRISTLEKRRKEKLSKYKELTEQARSCYNMDVTLHVIVVSSLGAVPRETYKELATLLRGSKRMTRRTARTISVAAIRGSALIYWGLPIRNGKVVQEQSSQGESEGTMGSDDDPIITALFRQE